MAHNHVHQRKSNIALVFFINLFFTILELVGGILTNSVAVISNAIHDSGDVLALGLSWRLEGIAERGRDQFFSFGYKRFSLLAALINGVILLGGTAFIILHAVPRIFYPQPVDLHGMVVIAFIGITINGLAALRLRKGRSMNENVLTLHLLEDVLGWTAVLIVATTMMFTDLPVLDPILSLVFALFMLWNAVRNLKTTLKIFLQSIPDDVNMDLVEKAIAQFPGVIELHDTHVWSLDGEHHVLSTHITVEKGYAAAELETLKSMIRLKLSEFDIQHATIEIDFLGSTCQLQT